MACVRSNALVELFVGLWRMNMYYCYLGTPIGELLLAGDEDALCFIGFPEGSMRLEPESDWIFSILQTDNSGV